MTHAKCRLYVCSLFGLKGQSLVVRRYLPPSCSTRKSVVNMAAANRQRWRFPKVLMNSNFINCANRDLFPMGVCNSTHSEDGWIDLAAGPEITITVNYISRRNDGLDSKIKQGIIPPANTVDVQVKIPDAVVRLFGFLARDLLAVKVITHTLSLTTILICDIMYVVVYSLTVHYYMVRSLPQLGYCVFNVKSTKSDQLAFAGMYMDYSGNDEWCSWRQC